MKRAIILTFCLLSYLVEAQQQKPKQDSSWSGINDKLNTLSKKVTEVNKKAVKKVKEVKQQEEQALPDRDTVLIGLDRYDSLRIYYSLRDSFDAAENVTEPVKKKTKAGKFLHKIFK